MAGTARRPQQRLIEAALARRALLIIVVALCTVSCAKAPAPEISPDRAIPGLTSYFERVRLACGGTRSYQAHGSFDVENRGIAVKATHVVAYKAASGDPSSDRYQPERLRLDIDFKGFLWIPAARGELLARGDSLYASIPRFIAPWSGTRQEFVRDWSWQAVVMLAILADVQPHGPLGCIEAPDLVLRDPGGDRISLECVRDGLFWQLLIDADSGLPRRGRLALQGDKRTVVRTYRGSGPLGAPLLPEKIELHYPSEDLSITIIHDEQELDVPLADSLFEPDRTAG